MLWLRNVAVNSASVLRVSSTTDAVGFYERHTQPLPQAQNLTLTVTLTQRYMTDMGHSMLLFDGTAAH